MSKRPKKLREQEVKSKPKTTTFKPKTKSQEEYVKLIHKTDILFAHGIAGSGKTFAAAAIALQYLFSGKIERIVITRPVVEAGEHLGFLPGKANDKIRPYIEPILDSLRYFVNEQQLMSLISNKQILIEPIAYMRGRTFNNALIIVDEAQNCSTKQLILIITRLGQNSKMIVNGDISQSDLLEKTNGLQYHLDTFANCKNPRIATYHFSDKDVIRNELIEVYLEIIKEKENAKSDKTAGKTN